MSVLPGLAMPAPFLNQTLKRISFTRFRVESSNVGCYCEPGIASSRLESFTCINILQIVVAFLAGSLQCLTSRQKADFCNGNAGDQKGWEMTDVLHKIGL